MLKHGGSDIYNITKLKEDYSVTTNFLGPSSYGLKLMIENINQINHYPSENKTFFKEGLDFLGVKESNIMWGNGASELIDLVIRTLTKANSYKTYSKFNDTQYMEYERCCINNQLEQTDHGNILLIINPNNPTGDFYDKDDIKQRINMLNSGSTVIIDESMLFWIGQDWYTYSFLSEENFILSLKQNKNINIIIVHSWTKIFSCTGLRFGSVVCFDSQLIKEFEQNKTPWSANILSYYYLKGCLSDKKYLEDTWMQTPLLRQSIKNKIIELFPFAEIKGRDFLSWLWVDFKFTDIADMIYEKSLEYGIPVRQGKIGYNKKTYLRFAVRTEESNIVLFKMLTDVKINKIRVPNYHFRLPDNLVYGIIKIPLEQIKSHEEHISERKNKLLEYLNDNDYFILPSIILDSTNFVILDGHHRLNILKDLGKKEEYVLLINYNSESIIPHETNNVTKKEIIEAGLSGKLLPSKSSKHVFIDSDEIKRPLISLSVMVNG
jgi:histidinol-phosphate/aromatic aminotransferase/cobyric acid decarboxylase-like protein